MQALRCFHIFQDENFENSSRHRTSKRGGGRGYKISGPFFFTKGPIARLVEEVRYDEAGFPREIRTRDYLFVVSFHYLINFFTIIHCLHACHLYYYLYTNVKYFCWRVCIDVVHSTLVGVDELG